MKAKRKFKWTRAHREKYEATIAARKKEAARGAAYIAAKPKSAYTPALSGEQFQKNLDQARGSLVLTHNPKEGWHEAVSEAPEPREPDPFLLAETYILRGAARLDGVIDEIAKTNPLAELALKFIQNELVEDSRRVKKANPALRADI